MACSSFQALQIAVLSKCDDGLDTEKGASTLRGLMRFAVRE